MLKGIKKQPTKKNHAMMEMLSGRAGRCGAVMGGAGSGATSPGFAASVEVLREGGGGVAE